MARFNSLLGRNKFPVPMRRELGRKYLNLLLDFETIAALGGPDEQNSRNYVADAPSLYEVRRRRARGVTLWRSAAMHS